MGRAKKTQCGSLFIACVKGNALTILGAWAVVMRSRFCIKRQTVRGLPKKRHTQDKLFVKNFGKLGVSCTATVLLRTVNAVIKGQGGCLQPRFPIKGTVVGLLLLPRGSGSLNCRTTGGQGHSSPHWGKGALRRFRLILRLGKGQSVPPPRGY